jgi:hypothetical protein
VRSFGEDLSLIRENLPLIRDDSSQPAQNALLIGQQLLQLCLIPDDRSLIADDARLVGENPVLPFSSGVCHVSSFSIQRVTLTSDSKDLNRRGYVTRL